MSEAANDLVTSGSSADKDAWVARVLGLQMNSARYGGVDAAAKQAQDAIDYVAVSLRSMPEASDFPARLADIRTLLQSGDPTATPQAEVLRDEVAAALSKARAAEAGAVSEGATARAKLLLDVRKAHAAALANLRNMGSTLLALPEVQTHPQLEEVKNAVKRLPTLIPALDRAVTEALGRYDDATTPDERNAAARDASKAVGNLQKLLRTPVLINLEDFAAADMGGMTITQDLRAVVAGTASTLRQSA